MISWEFPLARRAYCASGRICPHPKYSKWYISRQSRAQGLGEASTYLTTNSHQIYEMLSRCALQVLTLRSLPSELPPVFLAPLLASTTQALHKRCSFSTTSPIFARTKKRRDGNADRGVSALRRTGLRRPVDMSFQPLPKPVLDPQRRSKVQVDPNHGLWGFFNQDRKALNTPEQDNAHGTDSFLILDFERGLLYSRSAMDSGGTAA